MLSGTGKGTSTSASDIRLLVETKVISPTLVKSGSALLRHLGAQCGQGLIQGHTDLPLLTPNIDS